MHHVVCLSKRQFQAKDEVFCVQNLKYLFTKFTKKNAEPLKRTEKWYLNLIKQFRDEQRCVLVRRGRRQGREGR